MVRTFLKRNYKICDAIGENIFKNAKFHENSIKYFGNVKLDIYFCPFSKKFYFYKNKKMNIKNKH